MYISKDGYMETFVVNETSEDVWFDNMMVMSVSSAIVQETHYDPWGLELTLNIDAFLGNFDIKEDDFKKYQRSLQNKEDDNIRNENLGLQNPNKEKGKDKFDTTYFDVVVQQGKTTTYRYKMDVGPDTTEHKDVSTSEVNIGRWNTTTSQKQ